MAIIKKYSPFQNLTKFQVLVNDSNPNSDYFRITEFKDTFTGGKNGFLIEGSEFLKETTEVKIEILDVEGNPIYFEPGDGTPEYYEGLSKLVSVHVYDDTPIGLGKITILGELKNYINNRGEVVPIPAEWKGIYNVKWEKSFKINKNLNNEDIVRFYKRPIINITEIVKPIFDKTIPTKTISGSVSGIPQQPIGGTDLTSWTAGTLYKLVKSSGSWDVDVDENDITVSVDGSTYTPKIIEVLNQREVLVDIPHSSNNVVQPFTSQSFTMSYQDVENEVIGDSALTGSFAKIDMYQLKTFVGDVARVKIFRKSRNQVNDFQLVQESKLESAELLRDITVSDSVEVPYGRFTDSVLSNYWETSSNDHTTTINSAVLNQAVKVDYNTGISGTQKLTTQNSFTLSKDVEYTLSFRTLLSGSLTTDKYIDAYFSGSYTNSLGNPTSYTQSFMYISGSSAYKTRQSVSQNILAERDIDAKLVFEFKGDDWYVSNVSLRNAQETSFSPDEFTLIQDIPRKLETETFDFRFEFYDINNNYIPVDVTATKEFDGGNDYVIGGTSARILTFDSNKESFRYISGSASPAGQLINFSLSKTNLTGSITYTSQAFDETGSIIQESGWELYPGFLTTKTETTDNASAVITVSNFEGTWTGSTEKPEVFSLTYTASVEDLYQYESVFRVEDGENAPTLIVSPDDKFTYEPTILSPKPLNQSVSIKAQRKNLESSTSLIKVFANSSLGREQLSGSSQLTSLGHPDISGSIITDPITGVSTYTLTALQFSQSFASNSIDEIKYEFTGSDIFGNEQTDEYIITKVINFDGVSIVLSNESTTFPATSTGTVTGGFVASSGSVQMYIGGTQITHIDGLTGQKNAFDIISASGDNVTPTDDTPNTANYSISSFETTKDSGSLTLDINYIAGDGITSQSFQKVVSYTKAKKGTPNVEVAVTPPAQTIDANSLGSGSTSPQDLAITALEGGTPVSFTIGNPTYSGGLTGSFLATDKITFTDTASDMTSDTETITIPVNYTDSEGTTGQKTVVASISRVRTAPPNVQVNVSPQSQNISSGSSVYQAPSSITVSAKEGSTSYTYGSGNSKFTIGSFTGPFENSNQTITTTLSNVSGSVSGSALVSYTNSEGTSDSETIDFSIGVSVQGTDGLPGPSGSNGESGSTGPGVVFRGKWDSSVTYKFSTDVGDGLGRRDSVMYGSSDYIYGTLQESTNQAPTGTTSDNAYWQFLGSEQMFVAAEIAIFKNSFVKETLNVGLNAEGSEANIAIVGGSTSPYISIGQSSQGYDNSGIFVGVDSADSDKKLSLVGDNGYLKWDGSVLSISGSIQFTNQGDIDLGGFNNDQGFTDDTAANNAQTTANAATQSANEASASAYTNLNNLQAVIDGNTTLTGTFINDKIIYAPNIAGTTGYISDLFRVGSSGITLDGVNKKIYVGTGTHANSNTAFYVDNSNNFSLGDKLTWDGSSLVVSGSGEFTGQVKAGNVVLGPTVDGTNDGVYIDSNNYWVDGGSIRFRVGNATNYFTVGNTGAIQANVATQGLAFYNSSDQAQGLAIGPYDVYITANGTGNTQGKVSFGAGSIKGDVSGTAYIQILLNSGGYLDITDGGSGGDLVVGGDIDADGNITAYASSDKNLKDNIIPISNALQKIIKIGGYEFDWNDKQKTYEGHDVGVIAQEIKEVLPEVVTEKKDGYLGVRYEKIVPLLIEGIKELTNKVESLENEILKLKEKK